MTGNTHTLHLCVSAEKTPVRSHVNETSAISWIKAENSWNYMKAKVKELCLQTGTDWQNILCKFSVTVWLVFDAVTHSAKRRCESPGVQSEDATKGTSDEACCRRRTFDSRLRGDRKTDLKTVKHRLLDLTLWPCAIIVLFQQENVMYNSTCESFDTFPVCHDPHPRRVSSLTAHAFVTLS